MKVTRFDPEAALIIARGYVWSRHGRRSRVRFVIDTGAQETAISPAVLDELGYSARQGEARTIVRSTVGEEPGYLIRVARMRALGFEFKDFRVHALDIPDGWDIEGLLGLSFLRYFRYTVDSGDGRLEVERLARAISP